MYLAAPSTRASRASDAFARDLMGRVVRFLLVVLGLLIMAVGLVTTPLPGHLGLPILMVGLIIVLRNSFKARRRFVAIQRAHPKMVFPLRRLLRREPEVVAVFWQQALRVERLVLRTPRLRFMGRTRRSLVRGRRRAPAANAAAPVAAVPTICAAE
ncbi:MAG: hypothetical protein ACXWKV_17640 [Caulobacteraceae bacterium]